MGELAPFIILKGNMSHGARHTFLEFYKRRFLENSGEEVELGGGIGREYEEKEEEGKERRRKRGRSG